MESNRYEDKPIRQIEADKAWGWGILLGLVIGATAFYNPINVSNVNQPSFQRIDGDKINDMVDAEGRIFLADETNEALTYRRFTSSDTYRIR